MSAIPGSGEQAAGYARYSPGGRGQAGVIGLIAGDLLTTYISGPTGFPAAMPRSWPPSRHRCWPWPSSSWRSGLGVLAPLGPGYAPQNRQQKPGNHLEER
jgi:hypothetical protein